MGLDEPPLAPLATGQPAQQKKGVEMLGKRPTPFEDASLHKRQRVAEENRMVSKSESNSDAVPMDVDTPSAAPEPAAQAPAALAPLVPAEHTHETSGSKILSGEKLLGLHSSRIKVKVKRSTRAFWELGCVPLCRVHAWCLGEFTRRYNGYRGL